MLRPYHKRPDSEGDDRSLRTELEDSLIAAAEILSLTEECLLEIVGSKDELPPHLEEFFSTSCQARDRWGKLVPRLSVQRHNQHYSGNDQNYHGPDYRPWYAAEEEEQFSTEESKELFLEVVKFLEGLKGQECSMDRIGFQFGNAFNSRVRTSGRRNDGALRRWLESHSGMVEVVPHPNTKNKATVRLISKNWPGIKGKGKGISEAENDWSSEAKGLWKTKDTEKQKEKDKKEAEDSGLTLLEEIVEYVTSQGGQVPLDKVGGRFGGSFNRMVRKTGSGNDGALRRWLSNHTDKVKIITDKTQKGGSGLVLQLTNPLQ